MSTFPLEMYFFNSMRIADSKKLSFLGILMLTSRYRWLTDFISTVNLRLFSATSQRPNPVILFIICAPILRQTAVYTSLYYMISLGPRQGGFLFCVESGILMVQFRGCGWGRFRASGVQIQTRFRSVKNATDARLESTSPSTGVFIGSGFVPPTSGSWLAALLNVLLISVHKKI